MEVSWHYYYYDDDDDDDDDDYHKSDDGYCLTLLLPKRVKFLG